jgi:hypothetical protein
MKRFLLVLLAIAWPALVSATSVSVPADMPSMQQALSVAPDTIIVEKSYALAEDIAIKRRVLIQGQGDSHPVLGHVSFVMPDQSTDAITIERMTIAGTSGSGGQTWDQITLKDCVAQGTVRIRYGRIVIEHLQVAPGFGLDLEGTYAHVQITDVHVSDVPGVGIHAVGGEASVYVQDCTVERCGSGIVLELAGGNSQQRVLNNVVIGSRGNGIVTQGSVTQNTVARSGGDGIVCRYHASGNISVFNGGLGIRQLSEVVWPSCNDLFGNAADGRPHGDNLAIDPLFCDLAAGDLRLDASSPLVGSSCGQIGALGVGCGTQALASVPHESGSLRIQGRRSAALVTLGSREPATLDVLDVAGRRLSRTAVAASGEVPLRDLPAGLYFLRLTQGAASVSGKALVTR